MGVNRCRDKDGIHHWRRLHAIGHAVLVSYVGIEAQRRRRLHGFARQLAPVPEGFVHGIVEKVTFIANRRQAQSSGGWNR